MYKANLTDVHGDAHDDVHDDVHDDPISPSPHELRVEVVVPIPIDAPLTYSLRVSAQERPPLRGEFVWVPLGQRFLIGCIWEINALNATMRDTQSDRLRGRVKAVKLRLTWIPPLPETLLSLLAQLARYYHVPLGLSLDLATPNLSTQQSYIFTHPDELKRVRAIQEAERSSRAERAASERDQPSLFSQLSGDITPAESTTESTLASFKERAIEPLAEIDVDSSRAGDISGNSRIIEALSQLADTGPLTYRELPFYLSQAEWSLLVKRGVLSEHRLPGRVSSSRCGFILNLSIKQSIALKTLSSPKLRQLFNLFCVDEADEPVGISAHHLLTLSPYSKASGLKKGLRTLIERGYLRCVTLPSDLHGGSRELEELTEPSLISEQTGGSAQESRRGERLTLTREQRVATEVITSALGFKASLLHGVTGSGKTEVYLEVIERTLARGEQALVLIPEIGLTPQTLRRFQARLSVPVYAWHSQLTASERLSTWVAVGESSPCVLVGARSALFAPLPKLGLIIVDESHDGSYKQGDGVRYHARDMAVVRAKITDCPIILGSATPSLESMYNAQTGKYQHLELTERPQGAQLPQVRTVDLTQSKAVSPRALAITYTLAQAIAIRLKRQEQVILFLNRRGFSQSVRCQSCGFLFECPTCATALPWHRATQQLQCHHCEFKAPVPNSCPQCHQTGMLAQIGKGTERIEDQLTSLFPHARIRRLDRDSELKPYELQELMSNAEIDILIGTQMVTKGHDFPLVTLVGVIDADVGLDIPDFRANERSYQLLSQVSGRAGRAERAGEVIVQTYRPKEERLLSAITHDYGRFYLHELSLRQAIGYPPFGHLATIRLHADLNISMESALDKLHTLLTQRRPSEVLIRGPSPAPLSQLQGRQRWITLLISPRREALHILLKQVDQHIGKRLGKVNCVIDVDPYDFV